MFPSPSKRDLPRYPHTFRHLPSADVFVEPVFPSEFETSAVHERSSIHFMDADDAR